MQYELEMDTITLLIVIIVVSVFSDMPVQHAMTLLYYIYNPYQLVT